MLDLKSFDTLLLEDMQAEQDLDVLTNTDGDIIDSFEETDPEAYINKEQLILKDSILEGTIHWEGDSIV